MKQNDDIEIMLTLNPHGWSTCLIIVNGKITELSITHVFGDPYYDLIRALIDLLNGKENVVFFLFGEPGGEKVEITRIKTQQHKVQVTINGFPESFGEEIKEFYQTTEFEIKLRQFLSIFYFQLKKTAVLMQEQAFAKTRDYFPYNDFYEFESLLKEYLESGENPLLRY